MGATRSSQLGSIADSDYQAPAVDVAAFERQTLLGFLRDMLRIRFAEEAVATLVETGLARAPCHLGIGQEAIAVGVSHSLRKTDRVFGGHRSHSHYLALGGSVYQLLAEVLGKRDGTSKGMGGSMHLFGQDIGFYGSVPLVGATISIAVGAAIAARMDGTGDISVAYFGDGATEEGVFHESMNLAATFGWPVLFVCENNLFSSHLHIGLRQPTDRIGRYGEAHCVATRTVDGNDVTAMALAARELVAAMRQGQGPALLEAVTYRHRGHVGANADIDVGVQRKREDIEKWVRRDPIDRLVAAMRLSKQIDDAEYAQLQATLRQEVTDATARAEAAEYPPVSALLDLVYRSGGRE